VRFESVLIHLLFCCLVSARILIVFSQFFAQSHLSLNSDGGWQDNIARGRQANAFIYQYIGTPHARRLVFKLPVASGVGTFIKRGLPTKLVDFLPHFALVPVI